jgi:Asp/Glu/hydantoin racemase
MPVTLALLHTTSATLPVFGELAKVELPGVRIVNLLDDSLLADVVAAGEVPAAVEKRIAAYVEQASVLGATAAMSCCSSIGEAVERIATSARLPLWRIDEAMAEEAIGSGPRVGVAATVSTTLGPTARLVERKARELGRADVTVTAKLVDGAFAALQAGDRAEHDRRIRAALGELVASVDVVVLAQASMAAVATQLDPKPSIQILTSPVSGLRRARQRLATMETR